MQSHVILTKKEMTEKVLYAYHPANSPSS